METQTKTYAPRYATKWLRERNLGYVSKYYHLGGGKQRCQIKYYFKAYPELAGRIVYDEADDIDTRLKKIKDETKIIKLERKLNMRVVEVYSTDQDTSSEKSDD